jgi:hypothetical protein
MIYGIGDFEYQHSYISPPSSIRHSREGGNPGSAGVTLARQTWIPAFAGMTVVFL